MFLFLLFYYLACWETTFLLAGETLIDTRMAWRTNSSKWHPGAEAWPKAQPVALGTWSSPGSQEQHLPWGDSHSAPMFLLAKWCLPSDKSLQTLSSSHHDPGIRSAEIKVTERPQVKVGSERTFMQTKKPVLFQKSWYIKHIHST